MTERAQLGWRVSRDVWNRFVEHVGAKWGDQDFYLRFEIESAMREYLDEDKILARAEVLLREYTALHDLSSSTAVAAATKRYRGDETKLITHRVQRDLKERFQAFADDHNADSYGRLLAAALDAYADGGRARRLLDDIEALATDATTTGSTDNSVENTPDESDSTVDRVESDLSTDQESATTDGSSDDGPRVDPQTVLDIADGFAEARELRADALDRVVAREVGGDRETLDAYRAAVLEQLNMVAHPHEEGVYLTEQEREDRRLWADLDKAERIILLRRWLATDALSHGTAKTEWSYRDVIAAFEDRTSAGPSHQYAYDLMEAAADEPGFDYGSYRASSDQSRKVRLRVDIDRISRRILEWVVEHEDVDRSTVSRIADITTYGGGIDVSTEVTADE